MHQTWSIYEIPLLFGPKSICRTGILKVNKDDIINSFRAKGLSWDTEASYIDAWLRRATSSWSSSLSRRYCGSTAARTLWTLQHVSILRTAFIGNNVQPPGKRTPDCTTHGCTQNGCWHSAICGFIQCPSSIYCFRVQDNSFGKCEMICACTRLSMVGFERSFLEPEPTQNMSISFESTQSFYGCWG